ncbi:helix-turn-helix domain-containing protein [candidate division WOR-3 bacterium]|uniref:Helix-turn-helix domain-containing protein n=1 Tax=candidate division WOR-3 bacterium TaxID=2052148 RepID=A0A9D5K810_UNCW3|nr:helix-turn-helix domain-containing protein [candidate division WOR-3 bacterium]MBD3364098.1 helix-turn-helix domain-containing protein [candidate division WOR-3 bacterium]
MVKAREGTHHTPSESKGNAVSGRLERLKLEWKTLLDRYANLFSCSFSGTFAREIEDPWQVFEKGRKFQHALNKTCAGSNWETKQGGVLSAFAVERGTRSTKRVHTYQLIGYHPMINPAMLKELWIKKIDKNVDPAALSVTPRDDNFNSRAIPYFVKQIGLKPDWPTPGLYTPRVFQNLKVDESRRYIDPFCSKEDIPDFMSAKELAERLCISPATITNLIQRREIPYYPIGDRKIFNPAEIQHWIDSIRVSPIAQSANNNETGNDSNAEIDRLMKDVDKKPKSNSIGDLL